jgi:hypothetical protein
MKHYRHMLRVMSGLRQVRVKRNEELVRGAGELLVHPNDYLGQDGEFFKEELLSKTSDIIQLLKASMGVN